MVSLHFFLPIELVQELDSKVEDRTFSCRAEALRAYCQLGLKAEQFKKQIKDPEFLKSIDEMKQNDGIFEWLATLTPDQENAIAFAIQMDKEQRTKQVKFV
jgi:metal-responsive CopG/Arc/MetJ family transcriptional regulator